MKISNKFRILLIILLVISFTGCKKMQNTFGVSKLSGNINKEKISYSSIKYLIFMPVQVPASSHYSFDKDKYVFSFNLNCSGRDSSLKNLYTMNLRLQSDKAFVKGRRYLIPLYRVADSNEKEISADTYFFMRYLYKTDVFKVEKKEGDNTNPDYYVDHTYKEDFGNGYIEFTEIDIENQRFAGRFSFFAEAGSGKTQESKVPFSGFNKDFNIKEHFFPARIEKSFDINAKFDLHVELN